ncbi:hypothetical protein ACI68E_004478 [Malassezia pachydermatis]|uniref:Uncharacterized protein n=1 Tax=Malassezia pachydermatis TaxID=77020 RepID=A0A0M8ML75_9BASI|nr:hypothetical protein Malapachy_1739 [Malassezia pachydermatis]KOS13798.1 hypothetical protein Malapachy_1739 [Malassezia pachydermatis]
MPLLSRLLDSKNEASTTRGPKSERRKRWSFVPKRLSFSQRAPDQSHPQPSVRASLESVTSAKHATARRSFEPSPGVRAWDTTWPLGTGANAKLYEAPEIIVAHDEGAPEQATDEAEQKTEKPLPEVVPSGDASDGLAVVEATTASDATILVKPTPIEAPSVPPNGTPSTPEEVQNVYDMMVQRLKTITFLKAVINGEETYVYSVRFRSEDLQAAVTEEALHMWYDNSVRVCEPLEQAYTLTWPHEVLECATTLIQQVTQHQSSEDEKAAATQDEAAAQERPPLDIVCGITRLLDILYAIYAKLLTWLDQDALASLAEGTCTTPVIPSTELLGVLEQTDNKLRKFIKCIAKDLSYVARCISQHEMQEWDKILCDRQLDWDELSIQLQKRSERLAQEAPALKDMVGLGSPDTADIALLDAMMVEQDVQEKKPILFRRFLKRKDVRRHSIPMDLVERMRHTFTKRSSLSNDASVDAHADGAATEVAPAVPAETAPETVGSATPTVELSSESAQS